MNSRPMLTLLMMALAMPAAANDEPVWPGDDETAFALELDAAHPSDQRLHERWRPALTLGWSTAQRFAAGMVCDLGVVALALPHCLDSVDADNALSLPRDAEPDWQRILRRPVEERMQSI